MLALFSEAITLSIAYRARIGAMSHETIGEVAAWGMATLPHDESEAGDHLSHVADALVGAWGPNPLPRDVAAWLARVERAID